MINEKDDSSVLSHADSIDRSNAASQFREKHSKEARAAVAKAIWEISDSEADDVYYFMEVIQANLGQTSTPVENWIRRLPDEWSRARQWRNGLTPDDLVRLINDPWDGLRPGFDAMVEAARHVAANYPELLESTDRHTP